MKLIKSPWTYLLLAVALYLSGPNPATPVYETSLPSLPNDLNTLEASINNQEKATPDLKPENAAKIVWANDTVHATTEYAIVYLHGFTASEMEGHPVHRNVAKKFGCNMYLARLAHHGLKSDDAFLDLTATNYWESARDALAIGQKLGKKIILMGTSTGGTQALQLAATYPNLVHALILLSPNIEINDPSAFLLNNPWGLQIARLVIGDQYMTTPDQSAPFKKYWYAHYRLEGVVALQEMLETTMKKETFEKIHQPTLLLYFYADEKNQDPVVRVSAMHTMFKQLATADSLKRSIAMPKTGDHVLGSPIKSKDVQGVENSIESFIREIIIK